MVYGKRHEVSPHQPLHVTIRMCEDVPNLRCGRFVRAFRRTLAESCLRDGFRVVHYSIQKTHIHCVVEADGKVELANGMKSVNARIARAVNRVFERSGQVLERFHSRSLGTPKEVRNALAYVLLNVRKHWAECHGGVAPPVGLDGCSSGAWFDGWKFFKPKVPDWDPEVAEAQTWVLRRGWRRHRLIRLEEVPGR